VARGDNQSIAKHYARGKIMNFVNFEVVFRISIIETRTAYNSSVVWNLTVHFDCMKMTLRCTKQCLFSPNACLISRLNKKLILSI